MRVKRAEYLSIKTEWFCPPSGPPSRSFIPFISFLVIEKQKKQKTKKKMIFLFIKRFQSYITSFSFFITIFIGTTTLLLLHFVYNH